MAFTLFGHSKDLPTTHKFFVYVVVLIIIWIANYFDQDVFISQKSVATFKFFHQSQ